MKDVCTICGKKINDFRTSHLKQHGIDTFPGAVREYFREALEK